MDLQTLRFTLEERKRSLNRVDTRIDHLRNLRGEIAREIEELQGQIIAREGHAAGLHYVRRHFPNDAEAS